MATLMVSAVVDVAAERKNRLVNWLQDMGHRTCNLKLESDQSGYRMLASEAIERDATIVEVPRQAFLSEETADRCSLIGPTIRKSQLTSWQTMCLHLLNERARGPESFWHPYISVLPSQQELARLHPLFWPENLRKTWLAGSPMLDKIESRLSICRDDYEALLSAGVNSLLPSSPVTQESVRWAAAVLLSRAFSLLMENSPDDDTSLVLVPWADMLNHSSSAGMESCLMYDEELKMASLCSHKSYEEGEQVYDTYGPGLSGPQLLLDYGFVDEENTNYVVDLPASVLGPVKSPLNASLLEALGLPIDGAVFSLIPKGADDSVFAWTRAAIASPEELAASGWNGSISTLEKASLAMMYFTESISRENEAEVIRRLISACEKLSTRYPTSLEQDTDELSNSQEISWSQKQVLRALVSEKKALRGAEAEFHYLLKKLQ